MKVIFTLFGIFAYASATLDVKFYLFTHNNSETGVELKDGFINITDSPLKGVKIICHGYVDTYKTYWAMPTVEAYMKIGIWNVISVDWSPYAFGIYTYAVNNAPMIGQQIGEKVVEISKTSNIDLSLFHLIGHSLGAQIMGYAGATVQILTNKYVGRITGLDPAGLEFNKKSESVRLDRNDAGFVDIIHTDTLIAGYSESMGHVDFWPNGGSVQSGCNFFPCSHKRAPIYFYESIGNYEFPAWECLDINEFRDKRCFNHPKNYMGDNANSSIPGDFYLETKSSSPYGITDYN